MEKALTEPVLMERPNDWPKMTTAEAQSHWAWPLVKVAPRADGGLEVTFEGHTTGFLFLSACCRRRL